MTFSTYSPKIRINILSYIYTCVYICVFKEREIIAQNVNYIKIKSHKKRKKSKAMLILCLEM